jgi:hypothetical protein
LTLPQPGWFPDPTNPAQSRWWDGARWTDQIWTGGAVTAGPSIATTQTRPRRGRGLPWWGWLLIGLGSLILAIVLSPVFAVLSLVVLITSIVSLAKGTPTWLRFRGRAAAGAATAIAGVVFLVSGSVSAAILPNLGGRDTHTAPAPFAAASASPTPTADVTDDPSPAPYAGGTRTVADTSITKGKTALAVLGTLPVKGRAPKTGYDRAQFGGEWVDIDHNGCDTRNDILARDLTDTTTHGTCTVTSGVLVDPYTGKSISFTRGVDTSGVVQIDHVVSLGDAWQKGAQNLTAAQRIMLANDPLNLLAVSGQQNEQKRDGDAATWLPKAKSYRCAYVARQVSVKATYGLWVTQAEHDAIQQILQTCPSSAASTSTYAVAPQPKPTTAPTPKSFVQPAPAKPAPAKPAPAPPTNVYYANCDAVRAAGKAPLLASQPGYSRKLDRDGDGVACED